jgi:large subunit ribosomal protein L19
MDQKILEFERAREKPKIPELRPGDTVRVHQKIEEGGKTRTHQFQGVVLAVKHGRGLRGAFTVRKIGADGVGVEQVFFFHAPSIFKVERIRKGDPRRAKLYYLRRLTTKAVRKIRGETSAEVWEEEVIKPEPTEVAREEVVPEEKPKESVPSVGEKQKKVS